MLLASSSEESLEDNAPGDQFVPLVAGVSRWDYSDDDTEYALVRRKRAPKEAPSVYFFTRYWNKFKHWKDDHHIFFAKVMVLTLTIPSLLESKFSHFDVRASLKKPLVWAYLVALSFTWFASLVLWSYSLEYTDVTSAGIFSRMNPAFVLAWYVIRGRHVVPKEFIGVAVALLGTLVIGGGPLLVETFADDDNSTSSSGFLSSLSSIASLSSSGAVDEKPPLTAKSRAFGDMLNLISAGFSAAYWLLAAELRKDLPVFTFTNITTGLLGFMLATASVAFEGAGFVSGPKGLFSWVESEYILIILWMAGAIGSISISLNNYAIAFVDPLYAALYRLIDPFVSGLMSWLLEVQDFPGPWTWAGGGVTAVGLGIAAWGAYFKDKADTTHQSLPPAPVEDRKSPSGTELLPLPTANPSLPTSSHG